MTTEAQTSPQPGDTLQAFDPNTSTDNLTDAVSAGITSNGRAHLFVMAPFDEKKAVHDHAALDKAVSAAAKAAGCKATLNSRTVEGADVVFEK